MSVKRTCAISRVRRETSGVRLDIGDESDISAVMLRQRVDASNNGSAFTALVTFGPSLDYRGKRASEVRGKHLFANPTIRLAEDRAGSKQNVSIVVVRVVGLSSNVFGAVPVPGEGCRARLALGQGTRAGSGMVFAL
jgi:hypothetical protein